jgi:hypothetical protein
MTVMNSVTLKVGTKHELLSTRLDEGPPHRKSHYHTSADKKFCDIGHRWEYMFRVKEGSREAKLTEVLKHPKAWV